MYPVKDSSKSISIYDWFNPNDEAHLKAWAIVQTTGRWPADFIPDHVEISLSWSTLLTAKMADFWIAYRIGVKEEQKEEQLLVYKYPLLSLNSLENELYNIGSYEIEGFRKILTAQVQNDKPVLWVVVNPIDTQKTIINVYCAGTGHGKVPVGGVYVSTIQKNSFVWHIFAVVE